MRPQERLSEVGDILDGAVMCLPVTPGEARRALWDVNSDELVRQTLGVGACRLVEELPEDPAFAPRDYRCGDIVDGEKAVGRFLVYDRRPGRVGQYVVNALKGMGVNYEPGHTLYVVASLDQKTPKEERLYRELNLRLPVMFRSQFAKVKSRVLARRAAPAITV